MAEYSVQTNNEVLKFRKEIIREVIHDNRFGPYMGDGPSSIIQRVNDLKGGGDTVNIPIVTKLQGNGRGAGTLVNNEEKIDNYGCRFYADWARHAIVAAKNIRQKESAPVFDLAKPLLRDWGKELQRDELIEAMMALPTESAPAGLGSDDGDRVNGIRYETATAAQLNTWAAANSDRILYGNTTANYSGVHATDLAKVDSTADKFTGASGSLMKYLAKHTKPRIKPHMTKEGRDYYVAFHGSLTFRDLKADLKASNTDGRPRDVGKNPIFQDGDLIWDGVLHVEVEEIDDFVDDVWTDLLTAGDSSTTRVNPVFLCGQNALAVPWIQMPKPTRRSEDDYEFLKGVGCEMAYGVGKVFKKHPMTGTNLKQFGMVTGFFAASGT